MPKTAPLGQIVHDFQSELHAVVNAIKVISENFSDDPEFCEEMLTEICSREDKLFYRWETLKQEIKR